MNLDFKTPVFGKVERYWIVKRVLHGKFRGERKFDNILLLDMEKLTAWE